ncbi:MAG: (Fe-S)-binding protein [Coriobacteriia bacterium]|nr:(Fe-S)-binding protein [Coriobacteriia bacterium]
MLQESLRTQTASVWMLHFFDAPLPWCPDCYNWHMDILSYIDKTCIRCGGCLPQQEAEGMTPFMCGDLAEELLEAGDSDQVHPEVYEFVLGCSLCGACTTHCPEKLSCAHAARAGREKLIELEPELLEDYRAFRVDYRENLFGVIREAMGVSYKDYLETSSKEKRSRSTALFFPGCSLASYSEKLTRTTYELLESRGVVQGMTAYCCGKPLYDMGATQEFESYANGLIDALAHASVDKLVVACPSCFYTLKDLLEERLIDGIVLEALPDALLNLNITCLEDDYASVALHDSCLDRFGLHFSQATHTLFKQSGMSVLKMQNSGSGTICCGAGGLSQAGSPTLSEARGARRLRQFAATKAECLVCSCMSCVNAFVLGEGSQCDDAHHYLELLLGISVDWGAVKRTMDELTGAHDCEESGRSQDEYHADIFGQYNSYQLANIKQANEYEVEDSDLSSLPAFYLPLELCTKIFDD